MRVGLIGFGVGGAAFHAPLIHAEPGLELAAVVTSDPTRAAQVRSRYPGARVVAGVDDLWALDLDAVTITTPNSTHIELALGALEHGVDVVVDKPLATSVTDAQTLVRRAAELGRLLTVYLNRRWDGDFRTVGALLSQGAVGTPHRFESRFERWRPQVVPSWKESTDDGGGILFDLGPHVIDQALRLFGPVSEVYAEVGRVRQGAVNPDDVFLALTHAGRVRSHLWLSAVAAEQGPRFRVLGDAGAYTVHGMDPQEAALRAGATPGEPGAEPWGAVPESAWGTLFGGDAPVAFPTLPGPYPAFYRQWAHALRGEAEVPVDPQEAIAGLRIIEAANSALTTGG